MSARNDPPDRLDLLRAQLAEVERAMAETGFGHKKPRLRDRNGFVNALMHGERDTLEKVRPRWREYQRNAEKAEELKAQIESVVHLKVAAEPEYRALGAEADREGHARRSCRELLDAVRAARERVTRADTNTTDDAPRSALKRDVEDVADLLDRVRRHADALRTTLTGGRGLDTGELTGLHLEYSWSDSPGKRGKKLTEVGTRLRSFERTVSDLLREISARELALRTKQNKYMEEGRARYLR